MHRKADCGLQHSEAHVQKSDSVSEIETLAGSINRNMAAVPPPPMTALYTVAIGFSLQYVNRQTVCINSAKE